MTPAKLPAPRVAGPPKEPGPAPAGKVAAALREEQLRRVFESASDAIVTADATQRIVLANPAAAQVFRRPVEQLVGATLESLIPERFRGGHHAHVQRFGQNESATRTMGGLRPEVFGLRADGEEFPLEASISQVHADGERLYTVILRDVSERRRLEQALKDSHADLARLVIAQQRIEEEERKRISRELHDELQQVLAAIKMDVGLMEMALSGAEGPPQPAAAQAALAALPELNRLVARIDALATSAITSSRRIVNDLRPQLLEELGLVPALDALARQFRERHGVAVLLTTDDACADDGAARGAIPDAVALCLYRAAQEALNNVAKHAQATQVRLSLAAVPEAGGAGWRLEVADDGVGLAAGDRLKPASFGLRGIAERVRALGGTLTLDGEHDGGRGVRLVVHIGASRL